MKKYVCEPCGYEYDPAVGDPDNGIAPGTAFEDIPDDWVCPICGLGKDVFVAEDTILLFFLQPFIIRDLDYLTAYKTDDTFILQSKQHAGQRWSCSIQIYCQIFPVHMQTDPIVRITVFQQIRRYTLT